MRAGEDDDEQPQLSSSWSAVVGAGGSGAASEGTANPIWTGVGGRGGRDDTVAAVVDIMNVLYRSSLV